MEVEGGNIWDLLKHQTYIEYNWSKTRNFCSPHLPFGGDNENLPLMRLVLARPNLISIYKLM